MPRKPSNSESNDSKGQLNVALPPERYEVLKAAVYVRGEANLKDLVMPLLNAFIDELEQDEAVRLALHARELNRARAEGVLKTMPRAEAAGE